MIWHQLRRSLSYRHCAEVTDLAPSTEVIGLAPFEEVNLAPFAEVIDLALLLRSLTWRNCAEVIDLAPLRRGH